MKITWYWPDVIYQTRVLLSGRFYASQPAHVTVPDYWTVRDAKSGFNVCRVEFDPVEDADVDRKRFMDNMRMIAEIQYNERYAT